MEQENTYPFKGDFKKLKGLGYKFWKAYAMNYKVYSKKLKGRSLNVWVAHGGYIEYGDLYGNTTNFFEAIKNLEDGDYSIGGYSYIVFDWDEMNSKPKIYRLSLISRMAMLSFKKYKPKSINPTEEEKEESYIKARDEVYGGKNLHEVVIHKDSVKELLDELKLIGSY